MFAYVQDDVAHFLAEAGTLATRKRRLTSLRRFWAFVIADIDLPLNDPTIGFVAPPIDLQTPHPLTTPEQEGVLAAAASDLAGGIPLPTKPAVLLAEGGKGDSAPAL